MVTVLDAIALKLDRAKEHLQEVAEALDGYLKSEPAKVRAIKLNDMVTVDAVVVKDPPVRLSAAAGDCLTNLRASLDYLMWALCERYAGRTLNPEGPGADRVVFPIYALPERWDKTRKALAVGYMLPKDLLLSLETFQPYRGRHENEPLIGLVRLVNQDKHHLPVLMIPTSHSMDIRVNGLGSAGGAMSFGVNAPPDWPDGDVTDRLEIVGPYQISATVIFGGFRRGGRVDEALKLILRMIETSIVPKLKVFLR